MDLYSKDDDAETESDESSGDECEEIAGDIIDAVKSGDKAALAAALKQFRHYDDSGSSDEKSDHGGVLIALGKPKKD